ncbi:MAG: RES family NAD+ phosphorylase, partial [Bacillota bacterium]
RLEEAMGPAPVQKASHSRMSPQGISYMYLSDGPETCIAEIRPAAGEIVCLGRFRVIRDLRVVDLSGVNPRKRGDEARAARFLASFAREISRPLTPQDALLDYIPTQVLSEFIRSRGYDGIKYRSSQFESGFNYTLFCGPKTADSPADTRVIDPFVHWMRLEHLERKRVCSLAFVLQDVDEQATLPLSAAR